MTRRKAIVCTFLFSAGALLAGCQPRVDAEFSDVLITRHDIEVPGWPLAQGAAEPAATVSFVQKAADTGLPTEAYDAVAVRELIISVQSGATSLSFLNRLRVTMADAASGAPIEIARFERAPGQIIGTTLSIPRTPPADVLGPWIADSAIFVIELAGALPVERWTVDVGVRATAHLHYE